MRPPPIAIEEREAQRDVARRDHVFRWTLLAADLGATAVALAVATAVTGTPGLGPGVLLVLPLVALAGKVGGLYDRDELVIRKSSLDEAPLLAQLTALYALVIWVANDAHAGGDAHARDVAALWGILLATAFTARVLARRLAARATPPERCLFIGDAGTYARLGTKVRHERRVSLIGRMSFQRPARIGRRTAEASELADVLAWTGAHRVIVEPQAIPPETMHELLRIAKEAGVRVSLLPRVLDVVGSSVVLDELGGMAVLGVRRLSLRPSSARAKRAFDVVVGLAGIVLLAPVMAMVALLLALDGGPVLVRRDHIGCDGARFRASWFRRAPWMAGTALDRMPLLFSVLAGALSLVGPPPLPAPDGPARGRDRRRLALTPGLTGHWHTMGSGPVPSPELLKIDYVYVACWSVWSDLKILLRSARYLLGRHR